jgi:hypothetical protein
MQFVGIPVIFLFWKALAWKGAEKCGLRIAVDI